MMEKNNCPCCGRSPTGKCIGWYSLSEEVHLNNGWLFSPGKEIYYRESLWVLVIE